MVLQFAPDANPLSRKFPCPLLSNPPSSIMSSSHFLGSFLCSPVKPASIHSCGAFCSNINLPHSLGFVSPASTHSHGAFCSNIIFSQISLASLSLCTFESKIACLHSGGACVSTITIMQSL